MSKAAIIGVLAGALVVALGALFLTGAFKELITPSATSTTPIVEPETERETVAPPPTPAPARPAAKPPEVMTGTDTVVSDSTVVATGAIVPNGAVTAYWYEYGRTAALGTRTTSQNIGSGFVNITAPGYITGLSPLTAYYYRLGAENRLGTVYGETRTFTTNTASPPQGSSPSARTTPATNITRTTANLNGEIASNGAPTAYWFEYGETSELGSLTTYQPEGNGLPIGAVSVSISGLKPLTTYYYRLNAQNRFGTVNGAILNFTTSGPPAGSAPSANTNSPLRVGTSTVTLHGSLTPHNDLTAYWFEYGTSANLLTIAGRTAERQIAPTATRNISVSSDLSSLNHKTRYYYRLVGRNSYGTAQGDIVSFTTQ